MESTVEIEAHLRKWGGRMGLIFDANHAKALFAELALRLDSLESVPTEIRNVVEEALAGRGFEFTYVRSSTAGTAGDGLIHVQIAGKLNEALTTLRAMQGDIGLGHVHAPSR
jgi:hypothetical protein